MQSVDPSPPVVAITDIGLALSVQRDAQVQRERCRMWWLAPDVITSVAGSTGDAAAVTLGPLATGHGGADTSSLPGSRADVYMFGGLMFEVLSGGLAPFEWTGIVDPDEFRMVRVAGETDRVEVGKDTPGGSRFLPGLGAMSVLQAAASMVPRFGRPWQDWWVSFKDGGLSDEGTRARMRELGY